MEETRDRSQILAMLPLAHMDSVSFTKLLV